VTADRSCLQGVIAFGDSITHGGGGLQRDIASRSWALWAAHALGLPFTGYAVDGARTGAVASEQLAAWRTRAARPDARYDLGCLHTGVNDVREPDWDAEEFGSSYATVLAALAERCERLLVATLPLDLGRPRAVEAVAEANARIEAVAERFGALVVDLRDFGGREHLRPDQIHPTAFGQIEIAERALDVLAADGMAVRVRPSALIARSEATRWRRLRGDATYAYRHAKVSARAAVLVARARRAPPR
jgi:lysophospholipase L1-like esterase